MGYAGNILPGYSVTPLLINLYTSLQYKSCGIIYKHKGVHRNKSRGGGIFARSASTTLSLLQTKLAEKNCKLFFYVLHSSVSEFKSVIALSCPWHYPLSPRPLCIVPWLNLY